MTALRRRDHGGGLDAAIARFGGRRDDWLDLSTGINPRPFPLPAIPPADWAALPDSDMQARLNEAARGFWRVPEGAAILAAPGASALIARIPALKPPGRAAIRSRSYNEHAAAFRAHGWEISESGSDAAPDARPPEARVIVHPDNPDGRLWPGTGAGTRAHALRVIDESFCDTAPEASHVALAAGPDTLILKSFGKFWGLAGLRLGFAIGAPELIARLAEMLGPWPVSGPALRIGAAALEDRRWAGETRARLARDAARLDDLAGAAGWQPVGGCTLFRLYDTTDAGAAFAHLAQRRILSRIFPYSGRWLRLGLPGDDTAWQRLRAALAALP